MGDQKAMLGGLTSREAVLEAIAECKTLGRDQFLKKYRFKQSRKYFLVHDGQLYDSKAIAGVAYGKQHGTALQPSQFSGGETTVARRLEKLGFTVKRNEHPAVQLVPGRTYHRKDLLARFGGQLRAGIWSPKEFPAVFIFSGNSGKAYGYRDGWGADGVFRYTGEGQTGDMTFTRGNKAIRDHIANGKELLLFKDLGKGVGVRYEGLFNCISWEYGRGPDRNGVERRVIIFDLLPAAINEALIPEVTDVEGLSMATDLEDLRSRAYAAARATPEKKTSREALRSWYTRSETVKTYVLARARGVCEGCNAPAPFQKPDGSPYLEPHHTERVSDNGPDHPAWVAALCPNCHRRIHFGSDGTQYNEQIRRRIRMKEQGEARPTINSPRGVADAQARDGESLALEKDG